MIEIVDRHNPHALYNALSEEEKEHLVGISNLFVHEIITKKGSCAFNNEYGTHFIDNLGKLTNKYKVEYFFNLAKTDILNKYTGLEIELLDVSYSASTQEVKLKINATVNGVGLIKDVSHSINGNFTEKDILEQ